MKKILYTLAMVSLLALPSCVEEAKKEYIHHPAVNVTSQKLDPNTNESGTVRAEAGTVVTAVGLSLNDVAKVTVDGKPAKIVSAKFKEIKFEVPVLDREQSLDPYNVYIDMFAKDSTVVFHYPYYVCVPVVDVRASEFSPENGTVGTLLSITGLNLEKVSSVVFGNTTIPSEDFFYPSGTSFSIEVPSIEVSGADTDVDIKLVWNDESHKDAMEEVTSEKKFVYRIPSLDAFTQQAPAVIGDELTFSGSNIDLISSIRWDGNDLLLVSSTDKSLTVKIPGAIPEHSPVVASGKLSALFGYPAIEVCLIENFMLDTTPVGPKKPVFSSIAPTDTDYKSIFLGREVTVKGENMENVEGFELGGIKASLSGDPTAAEAKFVVPEDIPGNAAADMQLYALYNGGDKVDFGMVKVYPFFYVKGLKIHPGASSKSNYDPASAEGAYLMISQGRVASVSELMDSKFDPYSLESANSVIVSANKAAAGKEAEYSSVPPYVTLIATTADIQFYNPASSASATRHYLSGTQVSKTFGTPVVWMRVINEDCDTRNAIRSGTLEDILGYTSNAASANTPKCKASESNSQFNKNSVIYCEHAAYSLASTGGKPTAGNFSNISHVAYLLVKDFNCVTDGYAPVSPCSGYVEVDMYYSKKMN